MYTGSSSSEIPTGAFVIECDVPMMRIMSMHEWINKYDRPHDVVAFVTDTPTISRTACGES
jgi:hypothetical protein